MTQVDESQMNEWAPPMYEAKLYCKSGVLFHSYEARHRASFFVLDSRSIETLLHIIFWQSGVHMGPVSI